MTLLMLRPKYFWGTSSVFSQWWLGTWLMLQGHKKSFSSTLGEIDLDTAFEVCISVSLGFPCVVSAFPCLLYMVSVFPCFHYMVLLPNIWTSRPLFWVRRCYGLPWTLHCPRGRYCDVTMIRPFLFHGIDADLSRISGVAIKDRQLINYLLDFKVICCISSWKKLHI